MAWKLKTASAIALTVAVLSPMAYAQGSGNQSTLTGNHNGWLLQNSTNVGQADSGKLMDLSIILRAHNHNGQSLTDFVQSTSDPSSANYRHFVNAASFRQDFAPTDAEVNQVVQFLTGNGFTVKNTFSNNLVIQAVAPIGTVERTFNVTINQYQHGNKTFFANQQDPQVPSSVSGLILAIAGMTTFSNFATNAMNSNDYESAASPSFSAPPVNLSDQHGGVYGPQKVQSFYNVNPLYQQGNGKGTTLAIATLANFAPSDASFFWHYYGIQRSGSLNVVPVDGGFAANVPAPGAGETALDVEQSGSLAPGANIEVYEAPNTNPGFLDLFYSVAADNTADTMSVSWGEEEKYETPAYHAAMDQAFQEGAAEGISLFAAAGDDGAYDNGSQQLGVDSPASDPFITAAGGTIYPGMAYHHSGTAPIANINQESAWGWDWTLPYYGLFGYNNQNQWKQQIFPSGGGGGVSTQWSMPWYQQGLAGTDNSGRNVPDVSLNADPFSGYALYDSFSGGPYGSGWSAGWGGTSFVAPQLNGMTALMDSIVGGRLGFLNPAFYHLAGQPNAYGQSDSPFHDITAGDNWYYKATAGYDEATGIGSLNAANLETALSGLNSTH